MKNKYFYLFACLIIFIVSCESLIVKPEESNMNLEDFEAIWNRVNDVYPFLAFKKINWDSLHTVYRQRTEMSQGDEFLIILNDLLTELKDGHIYYKIKGGNEIYPYYPQRHFKDRHAYSPFVVRKYFDKELRITESSSAEYEILPQNIGYIFLSDFHKDYLANEFPEIMNYVMNTKGLIIDIRQKRGGDYQNVIAVIRHFLTVPLETPTFYILGELIEQSPFEPLATPAYTKPVVVLINGSTFSAGELTTEILKQLPNVTAVGDTTGGGGVASSGSPPEAIGEIELPSGRLVYIGTGYFERYDGQPFEWSGIEPDIRIVQTEADIKNGIDKQLEFAIDFLK
jgi:hypothetical protein